MRWWGYFAATASRSSCDLPTRGWISFPVIPTLPGFTWEYQQEFPKSLRFDDSCLGKCCFPQKMGGSLLHFTTIVSWTNEDLENFGTWTSWTSYLSEASAVSLFAEVRQMDGHRASAWNKIAEDHRDWDAVEDHRWTLVPGFPLLKGMISWPKKWEACSQPRKKHRNPMESPSRTMKIPPVPLCFESFYVFFFGASSGSPSLLPRKLGQLCGENSGLPTLCTDGWKGKGALAEGRAAAGEGHDMCARWKDMRKLDVMW